MSHTIGAKIAYNFSEACIRLSKIWALAGIGQFIGIADRSIFCGASTG
jgi:hypothetical protein